MGEEHHAVALPPEALRALKSATRLETPCGEGSTVWHSWGQGAPLVLMHGGSGSWMHWLRNVEPLASAGRRVLVPDLPGFGDSASPPNGQDADVLVEPIVRGLEALIGPVACDVVGFSFGGQVAGFMADQFPQRVRRLVIVGAPGMGLYQRGRIVLKGWRHLSSPAARDAVHRYNLQALMLWRPEAVDDLAVAIQAANTVRDRMQRRKLSGTDALGQALGRLTRPWRAIYGTHDALYSESMDDLLRILRAKPGFTGMDTIADAGHWVQYEQAEAFNKALLSALR